MMDINLVNAINQQKKEINVAIRLKFESHRFTKLLFNTLFDKETNTELGLEELETLFLIIRDLACPNIIGKPCRTWQDFQNNIPSLFHNLKLDAITFFENDPAAQSIEEVYLAYPGFFAISIYRMAHIFLNIGLPIIPRLMSEYAHQLTGIDIHPGAKIGKSFFIDHGTGVVIGETSEIHDDVKIYQGVTLGALKVKKNLQEVKRHPTVESNVVIYANASILGGNTVIGENSIIGGNTWITSSIAKDSLVLHNPSVNILSKNK